MFNLGFDLREREVAAPERLELRHEEAAAGARERLALRGYGQRGDTTADRQNFGKWWFVFGCIGTDLCKQIRVVQHFSKSTKLSS